MHREEEDFQDAGSAKQGNQDTQGMRLDMIVGSSLTVHFLGRVPRLPAQFWTG